MQRYFKNLFHRVRPYDIRTSIELLVKRPLDYSFPSGHTAASFTAVVALSFAGEKRAWKAALVLACLIAFSRMYLYVHYPTDVLGGVLVGIAAGYGGYRVVKALEQYKRKNNTAFYESPVLWYDNSQIITLQKGAFSMGDTSNIKKKTDRTRDPGSCGCRKDDALRIHAAQGRYCGQYRQSR